MSAAAIAAGGGSLIGGILGYVGQKSANAANAKQAQLNRDFQERMSSTAHQREVNDLRAAGLNPILSASKGGSSTPGGAQAQMQNALEPIANSAQQTAQIAAQMQLVKAQTRKTNNEASILGPKARIYNKAEELINNIIPDNNSAKSMLETGLNKIKSKGNEYATNAQAKTKAKAKISATFPNKPKNSKYDTNSLKRVKYMEEKGYHWSKIKKGWVK